MLKILSFQINRLKNEESFGVLTRVQGLATALITAETDLLYVVAFKTAKPMIRQFLQRNKAK